jgi:hypothetical protein
MVDAEVSVETTELADVIDRLVEQANGETIRPKAVTLDMVWAKTSNADFANWLRDRKNSRRIPHQFEQCGYVAFRNEANKRDGMWKIGGKRQVVYVQRELSNKEAHDAIQALIEAAPKATVTDLNKAREEKMAETQRQPQTKNDDTERKAQNEDDDTPF